MFKLEGDGKLNFIESHELEDMNKAVGGSIQFLCAKKGMVVYCNESGMLEGLALSAYIPDFLRFLGFKRNVPEMVFGNVIIHGDDRKISKQQRASIEKKHKDWLKKTKEEEKS
jgi:hypothetical protein